MSNPYDPPTPSELSLEDRIERLEARIEDNRPASLLEQLFGFLVIMGSGAFLFYVATRLGK